jgi:hypothetical protein
MNYRQLLSRIRYRGLVKAVVRDYHVLEGPQHYLVFSPRSSRDGSGNFTVVPKKAVRFLVNKLGGTKAIPTDEVFATCKGSMYFPDRFSVLNALYALIGMKGARISKIAGRKLFFNIWKGSRVP